MGVEAEGAGAEEEAAVIPMPDPTIITATTITQIVPTRILPPTIIVLRLQIVPTNLIRRVQSIQIFRPMLAGPVLSIGRKAVELRTAPIPWFVNGTRSSLHEPLIEKSANLEYIIQI